MNMNQDKVEFFAARSVLYFLSLAWKSIEIFMPGNLLFFIAQIKLIFNMILIKLFFIISIQIIIAIYRLDF